MRSIYQLLLIIMAFTILSTNIFAIKATPDPITIIQPDGSKITIQLQGDEYHHYKTTLDGYTLIANEEGVFTYATADANGNLVSSKIKANNIEKRTQIERKFVESLTPNLNFEKQNLIGRAMRAPSANASSIIQKFPLTGTPKSLVILVNFSDKSFVTTTPQTAFTNMLNQDGYSTNGGTGSAHDYFMASTYGKFSPTFDVVGPYTLPQNIAYYGTNDASGQDTNPQQMIIDACTKAYENGVNFAQYDTDNDGFVDNIFVYYAGYNEAENAPATTIWPHRWTLANYSTKFNSKIIYNYACTSELRGASGANMCGIGTFCHEFGHVLGLVDYYHTTETKNTLESWDIMDGGAYNNVGRTPPTYSVYDRFFLGYLTPKQVSTPSNLTLFPIYQGETPPSNTNNQAFLFSATTHNLNGASPSPTEFFMVEYRKKTGWDAYLPAEGMLIWHIDYNQSAWNNNTPNNYTGTTQTASSHMRVYLQPLIGSTTTPGTAFTTGSFTPTTWLGTNINREITAIKKNDANITFRLMGGGSSASIIAESESLNFSTVQGTPSACKSITINAKKLVSNLNFSFKNNNHFEFSNVINSDTVWKKSLSLTPNSDSTINNLKILVRYNPTEPSFNTIHTDSLILTSTNADTVQMILTGSSTRPVYVKTPIATAATDTTIASFVAHWGEVCNPICDATGYYLTVYNISEGNSEFAEGFDKGLTAPIDWIITVKETTTSKSYSGIAVPALLFKNSGELIQTEKYILPVEKLSFYSHWLTGSNGNILVEAWNGTNWNTVDNVSINSPLNTTKSYTFTAENNYSQFRMTFTKGTSQVAVDDITATMFEKLEYNEREKWVSMTADTLKNLVSDRDYFYKVRASDKTLYPDSTIKYENITNFSNIVQIKTLKNQSKKNSLIAVVDKDKVVTIIVPSTETPINVFNIIGQHIRSINPTSNVVKIADLPRRQAYIIQAGSLRSKVVL